MPSWIPSNAPDIVSANETVHLSDRCQRQKAIELLACGREPVKRADVLVVKFWQAIDEALKALAYAAILRSHSF